VTAEIVRRVQGDGVEAPGESDAAAEPAESAAAEIAEVA
jgi:hypothetical protein